MSRVFVTAPSPCARSVLCRQEAAARPYAQPRARPPRVWVPGVSACQTALAPPLHAAWATISVCSPEPWPQVWLGGGCPFGVCPGPVALRLRRRTEYVAVTRGGPRASLCKPVLPLNLRPGQCRQTWLVGVGGSRPRGPREAILGPLLHLSDTHSPHAQSPGPAPWLPKQLSLSRVCPMLPHGCC